MEQLAVEIWQYTLFGVVGLIALTFLGGIIYALRHDLFMRGLDGKGSFFWPALLVISTVVSLFAFAVATIGFLIHGEKEPGFAITGVVTIFFDLFMAFLYLNPILMLCRFVKRKYLQRYKEAELPEAKAFLQRQ